jgi:hypothetical protein
VEQAKWRKQDAERAASQVLARSATAKPKRPNYFLIANTAEIVIALPSLLMYRLFIKHSATVLSTPQTRLTKNGDIRELHNLNIVA